jgi:hypothetical protein
LVQRHHAFCLLFEKWDRLSAVRGKIKTGGYKDMDPIAVVPVDNADSIRKALKDVIARGNPIIEYDDNSDFSLFKYARVKSWSAFDKNAFCWIVNNATGPYKIIGQRKGLPRGWVDDPDQTVILPMGATVDDLCDRLIPIIQRKAGLF